MSVKGVSLGPAAALFVGLAVSAFDDRLANTPAIVSQIGLALFIYTVGLASGPRSWPSFARVVREWCSALLAARRWCSSPPDGAGLASLLDLDAGARTGLFAGVLTNTPALSAAIEGLGGRIADGTVTDPVVGYSLAYPLGVLAMPACGRSRCGGQRTGGAAAHDRRAAGEPMPATSATVLVTRPRTCSRWASCGTWNDTRLASSRGSTTGRCTSPPPRHAWCRVTAAP